MFNVPGNHGIALQVLSVGMLRAVASVSSGTAYTTALTVLGASFGMGNCAMGICAGPYLSAMVSEIRPARHK